MTAIYGCDKLEEDLDKIAKGIPLDGDGTDDCDDHYTPSSTYGDYGPSCPWLAPGMSISDFI